ncbi:MAG: sugar ABC transporter substrate-binding protein [Chloroflexota bacterium]|nr:MAG: sugar ABC transporter substrate-binding protein [Chloroflexota bacterium]
MDSKRIAAINITFIVMLALFLGVYAFLLSPQVTSAQDPTEEAMVEPKYHFVMVSHIGSNDPNMQWLTFAIEDFQKRFPEVKIDYVGASQSGIEELITLARQAIATQPDGIAIPILSSEPLDPVLREAIDAGIPVVAFNISDPRPADERIPYLAYVGGAEETVGIMLANEVLKDAEAGTIPVTTGAVCANLDPSHQGLAARCKGFNETMAAAGVKSETLTISQNQADAVNTMQAYLQGNPDVNVIFAVTANSGPWAYAAAKDLDLAPDVDMEGVTILCVDESPVSLEGIKGGHILATHSQGFYLQGFSPFEILYWNKELGYVPFNDTLTGPILINRDNIDKWIPFTRNIFGDVYDELAQGQWQ